MNNINQKLKIDTVVETSIIRVEDNEQLFCPYALTQPCTTRCIAFNIVEGVCECRRGDIKFGTIKKEEATVG